jgi:hypothetical protein
MNIKNMGIPSLLIQKRVSLLNVKCWHYWQKHVGKLTQQMSNTVQQVGNDTLWGSELFVVKCALHHKSQESVNGIVTKQDKWGIVAGLLVYLKVSFTGRVQSDTKAQPGSIFITGSSSGIK